MHFRERFKATDKFLGSVDLWDESTKSYKSVAVTIVSFGMDKLVGSMGEETKPFVKLKEYQKPMVMNKTNYSRLAKAFESPDEDDYIGKTITLTVEKVRDPQGGGKVDALRFSTRAAKPVVQQQKKKLSDADLSKAVSMIEKGATTVAQLSASYEITPEQLKALNDASKG